MSANLQVSREGRVLRVALDRPDKRNALNTALCRELISALEQAQEDAGIGAILLSGNGKAFCSGMDLDEALEAETAGQGDAHARLFTAGVWMRKPVVAAVHGAALAGGMGLVANAHIVVAAGNATFGLTEIRIGLWPFMVFRAVAQAIGQRRALELSLTGRTFGAEQAAEWGLVHQISTEYERDAADTAATLAGRSLEAVRSGLSFVQESRELPLAAAIALARLCRERVLRGPDFAEAVRAFRQKRT